MFELSTNYKLTGDQPKVINELSESIINGNKYNTLKGVTGSGKTFCMANIIQKVNKPTIIISHNKTLAAQLYSEFKELFPNNAVEYWVSHYAMFQPESYLPMQDKYIAKDSIINWDIERLRQKCLQSLCMRNDVIVIASVSAIFGAGDPSIYKNSLYEIYPNMILDRDKFISELVKRGYRREQDIDFSKSRGVFKVLGDVIYLYSNDLDTGYLYQISFWGDTIDTINIVNNKNIIQSSLKSLSIFSATSFYSGHNIDRFVELVTKEMNEQYDYFIDSGKPIYANRIRERVLYDLELIKETGTCSSIESYQRYLTTRNPGEPPYVLLDYFPKDYLMIIDESHATIPLLKTSANQNDTIKDNLINYGFRLPSVKDNRPLSFQEFIDLQNQVLYVSATPNDYEISQSSIVSEQVIRPTGLLDPIVEVRPINGQIDDIYSEIIKTCKNGNKTLITCITKKMAESLSEYLLDMGIKANYIHSDVSTSSRIDIINGLQMDEYDVLIGCNLLREGLSISNCELVIILDADKEGFLRNKTSLIQTIGRASRNENGRAILYADSITKSMQEAVDETNRHRQIQISYNKKHNIIPKSTSIKLIQNDIKSKQVKFTKQSEISKDKLEEYTTNMILAADELDFETAAYYRDLINQIKDFNN